LPGYHSHRLISLHLRTIAAPLFRKPRRPGDSIKHPGLDSGQCPVPVRERRVVRPAPHANGGRDARRLGAPTSGRHGPTTCGRNAQHPSPGRRFVRNPFDG
jgi:hypothetical protein